MAKKQKKTRKYRHPSTGVHHYVLLKHPLKVVELTDQQFYDEKGKHNVAMVRNLRELTVRDYNVALRQLDRKKMELAYFRRRDGL